VPVNSYYRLLFEVAGPSAFIVPDPLLSGRQTLAFSE
jgi:hypothetical protein